MPLFSLSFLASQACRPSLLARPYSIGRHTMTQIGQQVLKKTNEIQDIRDQKGLPLASPYTGPYEGGSPQIWTGNGLCREMAVYAACLFAREPNCDSLLLHYKDVGTHTRRPEQSHAFLTVNDRVFDPTYRQFLTPEGKTSERYLLYLEDHTPPVLVHTESELQALVEQIRTAAPDYSSAYPTDLCPDLSKIFKPSSRTIDVTPFIDRQPHRPPRLSRDFFQALINFDRTSFQHVEPLIKE